MIIYGLPRYARNDIECVARKTTSIRCFARVTAKRDVQNGAS